MNDSKLRSDRPESSNVSGQDSRLEELRRLILGPSKSRLDALERRIADPVQRRQDVGEVFAEALLLRDGKDQGVTQALAPKIEAGLRLTVERNPQILVDILFPIIGPLIRRAIAESMKRMLRSVNQSVEHSLTLRGLKWRWESWRSGRPFSEVVLLHTLEFRVEQVFLIHSESGLLIEHVAIEAVVAENPDLVSGMFTALRDFIKDAFRVGDSEPLGELQVGELTIWTEQAPHTTLAAVVRGNPSSELREILQETSETLHRRFGAQFVAFDGEKAADPAIRPCLEGCLLQEHVPPERSSFARALAAVLLLVPLLLGGYWVFRHFEAEWKFESYLSALRDEPGIVVTEARRSQGRYQLFGLRDPLAVDPEQLANSAGIPAEQLEGEWKQFFSSDEALVLKRARQLIEPPAQVELRFSQGRLHLAGQTAPDWAVRVRELAPLIPGVVKVDLSQLSAVGSEWFERLRSQVENTRVFFSPGSPQISSREGEKLSELAGFMKELQQGTLVTGDEITFEILGKSDNAGTSDFNQQLSRVRAERVLNYLVDQGMDEDRLAAVGQGEGNEEGNQRRVTFRVVVDSSTLERR